MPVDYKEGERSNLALSEFHHIVGTAFLYPLISSILPCISKKSKGKLL
jgi:hypothetical protein